MVEPGAGVDSDAVGSNRRATETLLREGAEGVADVARGCEELPERVDAHS